MPPGSLIPDSELIYNIWQVNGSICGPYASDAMYKFYLEGRLEFPTRIQISEARKLGRDPLLDYFGSVRDLQDLFGLHDFLPKRLSQFKGKWPLPDIYPNAALFGLEPMHGTNTIPFNFTSFLTNLQPSSYCPFITGFEGEVAGELALPLSSVHDLARRILMEYSNMDTDEKQYFHLLLTEVFSPRYCDVCQKVMEDQHAYIIHALSMLHLDQAVLRCGKVFTVEYDYLRLRRMLDDVKKYTFDVRTNKLANKLSVRAAQSTTLPLPPQIWNPNWLGSDFLGVLPLPLH